MLIRAALSIVLLVGAMLLPFVPGPYDPLAFTLSVAAAAIACCSLLQVPIGVAWLLSSRRPYAAAKIALTVATLTTAAIALATAAGGSLSAAALLLVVALTQATRLWQRVRTAQKDGANLPRTVPVGLVLVPLAVMAARLTLAEPAEAWSRNRVIGNAASIIADIERFRERTGTYPVAISSVHPDYKTGIVGVDRYRYEPSGQAYNLYFEHPSTTFGLQEIVMYNPLGEQDISSHAMDLLQLSPDDIRRQRGYFAAHDLPRAGWRRFLFD